MSCQCHLSTGQVCNQYATKNMVFGHIKSPICDFHSSFRSPHLLQSIQSIKIVQSVRLIPTTFPKSIKVADECCICSETVCRVVLGCQHTVCVSCIQKINSCPLCRHTIDMDLVKSV